MLKVQHVLRNEHGENVLKDYFDTISFKDKCIVVRKDDLIGIYDSKTFFPILKCEWKKVTFNNGYIVANTDSKIGVFDFQGKNVLNSFDWDVSVKLM